MPERAFLTETWDDDWFQRLSRDQRYLFIYLGTNNHCNQAGAYYITLATMAFETKFSVEELPGILKSLSPRVEWHQEQNYVWVKEFIKQQAKSPKFLIAAAKCLKNIKSNGFAKEIISYNLKEHSISIPYEYDSDSVSVGYPYTTDTSLTPDTDTGSKTGPGSGTGGVVGEERGVEGVVKGDENETSEKPIPRSRTEAEETLCEGDREVISVWRSVKGFDLSEANARELVARLRTEFADLDILAESKAWSARKLSEPLKRGSKPTSQLWNWMRLARKFAEERRQHGQRQQGSGERGQHTKPAATYEWRETPDQPNDTG